MRMLKLTFALLTLAGLIFLANYLGGQSSHAASQPDNLVNPHWKGASALTPVSAGPNPADFLYFSIHSAESDIWLLDLE